MSHIDWKDAYYSVPVAEEFQIYLCFIWRNKLVQFTCLPNGLTVGPRIFTKLTYPIYSELRRKGQLNASYIDDSYLQGDSTADCRANVIDTVQIGMDNTTAALNPKQYETYIRRWMVFYRKGNIDIFSPFIKDVVEFLVSLFKAGCGYSAINTAGSALSCFVSTEAGTPVGTHPLVEILKRSFPKETSIPQKYCDVGFFDSAKISQEHEHNDRTVIK